MQDAEAIGAAGLLRARRERPRRRRAAEKRDELASLQLIELHSASPPAKVGLQDIELAMVSQGRAGALKARARTPISA